MAHKEKDLIRQAQNGDEQAFTELLRIHDRRVLQFALSMLGNLQDAQDVYQESFMRAYLKISSFRFESEFATWLNRIVMNTAINRIRQRKLKRFFSIEQKKEAEENWDIMEEDDKNGPEQLLFSGELMAGITEQLDCLPPQQRSVFIMKHLHGYKISEIAETLQIAPGTIKNQLFRAVRKLRKSLREYR